MKILQLLCLIIFPCASVAEAQNLAPGEYTLLDHTRNQALSFSVDKEGNTSNQKLEPLIRPSAYSPNYQQFLQQQQSSFPVQANQQPSRLHNFLKGMTGFNYSLGQLQVQQDALNYNNTAAQYNAQHGFPIQPIPIPSNSQPATGWIFSSPSK